VSLDIVALVMLFVFAVAMLPPVNLTKEWKAVAEDYSREAERLRVLVADESAPEWDEGGGI